MIRDDPSRFELILPGLAVRVDPVRLLNLQLFLLARNLPNCIMLLNAPATTVKYSQWSGIPQYLDFLAA